MYLHVLVEVTVVAAEHNLSSNPDILVRFTPAACSLLYIAACRKKDPKFVYYLSAEFLMGRSLTNVVNNLGLEGKYAQALRKLGAEMETVADQERDASLGNGGLGRLAACFLDSIASLDLPGWGYGIRYKYGMFKQVCFPTFWDSFHTA